MLDTDAIRTQLHEMRQRSEQLANLLNTEARSLSADGIPASLSLVETLRQYRIRQQELIALWNASQPATRVSAATSLEALEAELARHERAIQACLVMRDILSISLRDGTSLPELESVQSDACSALASHGTELDDNQIELLRIGKHSWCDLLRMIREQDSLADAEWSSLNRSIEASFGRTLAIAASRGRLVIQRAEEPASPPEPVPSGETTPTVLIAEPGLEESPATADDSGPMTLPFRGSRNSAVERPVTSDDAESSIIRMTVCDDSQELVNSTPEPEIIEVLPEPLVIDGASRLSAAEESSATDSVFDDIAPATLTDLIRRETQTQLDAEPVATTSDIVTEPSAPFITEPTAPPITDTVKSSAPKSSTDNGSIFDDDSDEDELIRHKSRTPRNTLLSSPPAAVVETPSPLAQQLLDEAGFEDATGASASLAMQIFNGPEADRLTLLPDLILHLIHEGRPGLAFHLARGLESRAITERRFVPSWLIRTWTFGHALLFPKGQLAGLLQEDLRNPIQNDASQDRDWKLAMSLLVRAATLRPAIIAPFSRASAVLRDFDLRENCVQLYNYCSRIGTYGERIQGVFPGLFKQTRENVPYADQLSSLRADIARWISQDDSIELRYEAAQPLFQKTHWSLRAATASRGADTDRIWMNWQVALRLGESLIQPVLEDRRAELSRVRTEVEEITSKLSAHDDVSSQFSHPPVRAYLRQATTFAQRWISLHTGASAADSQAYLPQAAVELRSEVESRHEGVLQELRTLAENTRSLEVRMAVACLMLSVQEIRDLVDPSTPSETREPDPRHLLNSELLKIPELRLSTSWEPDLDPHTVEDEILKFLCHPQPDWATAFKMQLSQGNDAAAERILSLSLWSDEERDALEGVLRHHRTRQKSEFLQQLAAVRHLLNESVHLDILPEAERTGIETRLSRLQLSLNAESSVSHGILELDRVRDSLLKRREREAERIRNRLRQLHGTSRAESEPPPASPKSSKGWIMNFENDPPATF